MHHCHAFRCTQRVHPKMLMCAKHWRMVNITLQRLIWRTYRPGQEVDKKPSFDYLRVQAACRWHVAAREGLVSLAEIPDEENDQAGFLAGPEGLARMGSQGASR